MRFGQQTRVFLKTFLVLFVILFCAEGFCHYGNGSGAWAYRRQKAKQLPSAVYYADLEGGYPYNQGSAPQDMTYYDDPAVIIPNTGPTPTHYRVWNDRIGVGISAYPYGYGFDGNGSFAGHAGYIYANPSVANAQGAVVRTWNGHNSYFNVPKSGYRGFRRGYIGGIHGEGSYVRNSQDMVYPENYSGQISPEPCVDKKAGDEKTDPLNTNEFSTTPAQEPKKTSMNGYSTSPSSGHYNQQYVVEDPGMMGDPMEYGSFGGPYDYCDLYMDPGVSAKKECAILTGLKKMFTWRPKTSCLSKGIGGRPIGSCLGRGVSNPGFLCCDPCFPGCDPCFPCCDPCFTCCDPCFSSCDPCCGGSFVNGVLNSSGSCCGVEGEENIVPSNGKASNLPTPAPATSGSTPIHSDNKTFGIDSSIRTTTPAYPFGQKASGSAPAPNPAPQAPVQPAANPPKTPSPLPGTSGVLQMNVPENSVVYINGYRTKLSGTERNFTAKNLIPGETYEFEIKVVSVEDGQLREQIKTTALTPGSTAVLAFDFSEQHSLHTIALK